MSTGAGGEGGAPAPCVFRRLRQVGQGLDGELRRHTTLPSFSLPSHMLGNKSLNHPEVHDEVHLCGRMLPSVNRLSKAVFGGRRPTGGV